ncbi:MAG: hypothetical protein QNJ91_14790 [Gammaproteobacteria bacterium]|nr:hypothetical protein [Gammaproteobacteria bacterium]
MHYSHEMTEDTAESAARALIRAVPLVYGGLLGGLIGSLGLGIALGLTMSGALDWRMGEKSLFRQLLRPLAVTGCPYLSWLMRGIARGLSLMHLPVAAKYFDLHCGGA